MRKKMLAFAAACAVLFAEAAPVCSISANAAAAPSAARAVVSDEQDEPQQKKIMVKAYQITQDNVKILLTQKALDPNDSYTTLLNRVYEPSSYYGNTAYPEDTVILNGWFLSADDNEPINRYGKLVSDKDHAIYFMSKQLSAHYLKFDAGEGVLLWPNIKKSFSGNTRPLENNEILCPDRSAVGTQIPAAEWGTRAFLGWFTKPEGGEQITAETVISGEKEQTFYAHWDAENTAAESESYYVSMYDMTNEDRTPKLTGVRKINKGDSYGKIWANTQTAAKAAYNVDKNEFAPGTGAAYDWYTEKEGGIIIDRNSQETVPGDTAVYYRREIFPCHYLTLDAGEGEIFWNYAPYTYSESNVEQPKENQIVVMEQHKIETLPNAENGTHAFLGWFTEPEGGVQVDTETIFTGTGDQKLYAHWGAEGTTEAPKGFKLRVYTTNSTTGRITSQRDYRAVDCVNYHEIINGTSSSALARTSPKMSSDMVIPEGTTYSYTYFSEAENGKVVSLYDPPLKNEDHTIYLRSGFVPYYHVQFDANGGQVFWNGYKSTAVSAGANQLRENEVTVIKGDTFRKVPEALNGTRKFLGWFTKPEGGEPISTYSYTTSYRSQYSYTYFSGDSDMTYYAHWDEEGTAEAPDGVLMNCYRQITNSTDYVYYGNYLVKPGTSYAAAASSIALNTASALNKDIPDFKVPKIYWYSEPQNGICANSCSDPVPDHDFAVYGRSEFVGYHYVSFDPCEGDLSLYDEESDSPGQPLAKAATTMKAPSSGSTTVTTSRAPASNEIIVYEGSVYGKLMKAFQFGKKFLGWFTDPVGGDQVTEDTVFTGSADQKLYAHFGDGAAQTDVPGSTSANASTTTTTTTTTTTSTTKPTTTTTTTTSTTKPTTTTTTTTSATKPTTTTTTTTSTTKPTTTTTTTTSTTKPTTTTTTTTSATKPTTTTTTTTSTTKPTTTTTTATTSTTQPTTVTTESTETTVTTSETQPTETKVLRGDVNEDGTVSVEDAQLALLAYVESMTGQSTGLTEQQIAAADVNGDNIISVEDAQFIMIYYVKRTLSGQKVTWDEIMHPQSEPDYSKFKKSDALNNNFDPNSIAWPALNNFTALDPEFYIDYMYGGVLYFDNMCIQGFGWTKDAAWTETEMRYVSKKGARIVFRADYVEVSYINEPFVYDYERDDEIVIADGGNNNFRTLKMSAVRLAKTFVWTYDEFDQNYEH